MLVRRNPLHYQRHPLSFQPTMQIFLIFATNRTITSPWIFHILFNNDEFRMQRAYNVLALFLKSDAATHYAARIFNCIDRRGSLYTSVALIISTMNTPYAFAGPTISPEVTPAPPRLESITTQALDSCTEMGEIARAVAAWRDAGGASWMAKAKLDQRISEPPVKLAAQDLVDTLYSEAMRKLGPDETVMVVSASCRNATTPSSASEPIVTK